MSSSSFMQSDLRLLLPIMTKQRVLVIGNFPGLAEAMTEEGVHVIVLSSTSDQGSSERAKTVIIKDVMDTGLPVANMCIDHIIVPTLSNASKGGLLTEMVRVLKPDGYFLLGVKRPKGILSFLSFPKNITKALSLKGLSVLASYGIHSSLKHPKHFVPLRTPNATLFFFEKMFVVKSRQMLFVQSLAVLLSRLNLHFLIFNSFAIVGHQSPRKKFSQ